MLLSSFLVLKVLVFAITFVDQLFFGVDVAANLHKGISVLPGLLSSAGGGPGRSPRPAARPRAAPWRPFRSGGRAGARFRRFRGRPVPHPRREKGPPRSSPCPWRFGA